MKIMMILREDYPQDVRVAKEASRLIRAGHRLCLVCFNKKRLPPQEIVNGIEVERLSPWPSALKKVHTFVNNLPYRNPAWYGFILKNARKWGAEVLHVHDLPLARTVLGVAQTLGIPVVFDMHENWAELLPSIPRRLIERISATRFTFKRVEIEVCNEVDAVITVVEESKKRLAALGVPTGKIIVVPNVVDLERIPDELKDQPLREDGVDFIYAGGYSLHRGLDVLLKAWKIFIERFPSAQLLLAGAGPMEEDLESLVKILRIEKSVTFLGLLDFSNYLHWISRSHVGLVPHISTPHTDSTLPHKLFHYMAVRKPVVVGDAVPLRRIVDEERCGLVVRSGDVQEMVDALFKLASEPELRREMGDRGYLAVRERYNWDLGVNDLLKLYDSLATALGRSKSSSIHTQ